MIFADELNESEETEQVETTEVSEETQEVEPAEDTQDPQELLRAMREDREKDRMKSEALEQQNEFFRNLAMQQYGQQPAMPQPMQQPKFNPDDLLTYNEMNMEIESRLGKVDQTMRQMRGQFSEEMVKQKYPDYADVIEQLVIPQVRANPKLMEIIDNSDNPALTAYQLGCATPEYIAYQRATDTQKVTAKIEKNLSKPKTLGSTGTPQAKFTPGAISEMNSEDFARLRAKALGF